MPGREDRLRLEEVCQVEQYRQEPIIGAWTVIDYEMGQRIEAIGGNDAAVYELQ